MADYDVEDEGVCGDDYDHHLIGGTCFFCGARCERPTEGVDAP